MRFEMMIEKLDKQIEGLGVSMNEKFEELNRKNHQVGHKFDNLQDTMPAQINKVVMPVSRITCLRLLNGLIGYSWRRCRYCCGSPLCNGNGFFRSKK